MLSKDDKSEIAIMAKAAYCLFKSSLNQIRFIRARNEGRFADAVKEAENELNIAKEMLKLMNQNVAIGYEAANHYYFSKGQIAEKNSKLQLHNRCFFKKIIFQNDIKRTQSYLSVFFYAVLHSPIGSNQSPQNH